MSFQLLAQVSDLTAADPSSPESHQLLYAPLSSTNEIVTAAAVSSSGQFLAVGTSGGVLGQYAKPSAVAINNFHQSSEGMKSTELYRINEVSAHFNSLFADISYFFSSASNCLLFLPLCIDVPSCQDGAPAW